MSEPRDDHDELGPACQDRCIYGFGCACSEEFGRDARRREVEIEMVAEQP